MFEFEKENNYLPSVVSISLIMPTIEIKVTVLFKIMLI